MIYFSLLKRFWPFLVGAALLLAAWWWVTDYGKERFTEGVRITKEEWARQTLADVEAARQEVESVKATLDHERAENKKARDSAEQAERENQERLAEEREKDLHMWQSKIRAAIANNQECAAWSNTPVACPLR